MRKLPRVRARRYQRLAVGVLAALRGVNGTNQRWTRYTDGTIRGVGGKCVDNPDWQTANGTQFDDWVCNGGSNQNFQLQ